MNKLTNWKLMEFYVCVSSPIVNIKLCNKTPAAFTINRAQFDPTIYQIHQKPFKTIFLRRIYYTVKYQFSLGINLNWITKHHTVIVLTDGSLKDLRANT